MFVKLYLISCNRNIYMYKISINVIQINVLIHQSLLKLMIIKTIKYT